MLSPTCAQTYLSSAMLDPLGSSLTRLGTNGAIKPLLCPLSYPLGAGGTCREGGRIHSKDSKGMFSSRSPLELGSARNIFMGFHAMDKFFSLARYTLRCCDCQATSKVMAALLLVVFLVLLASIQEPSRTADAKSQRGRDSTMMRTKAIVRDDFSTILPVQLVQKWGSMWVPGAVCFWIPAYSSTFPISLEARWDQRLLQT